MLWVLKRTVSMRRYFWAPKTYAKTDELENIYNFTLKNFVYQILCCLMVNLMLIFHGLCDKGPYYLQRLQKYCKSKSFSRTS